MPIVADGAVRVGADLDPFNKELKSGLGKAEKQADTFSQKINSALSPKNLAAGLGIAFGASQVVSFFGDAVQAAGEFEDSVSATGVIFGKEAIPALQEWADEAHSAFGSSKQDALAAANQFAVFGKSAGLVGDDLTQFSTKLVQLGGDLASMFGGRTEDAIAAVGSALRGEFEPIRAYGVLLDDATLRQQAFEMGLISTTKNALTPQQKVLAAQASIFEQTTDAQGDFARTSDGLMNTQRDLAAELENVSIEVGEKLLPIMLEFVTFVRNVGIPAMRELMDVLDFEDANSAEGIPILSEMEDFFNTFVGSGVVVGSFLRQQEDEINAAAKRMGVDWMTAHRRIQQVMDETGLGIEEAVERVTLSMENVGGDLATILPQNIKQATSSVGDAVSELADTIPAEIEEGVEEAVEIAQKMPGQLADVLMDDIGDYQKALDELAEIAVNSVSDMTERQEIEGVLGSKALTDALNSDSTRTQLLAQQFVADRIEEYELLAPGALAAGTLVNPALLDGVNSNLSLAEEAGRNVVNAAGGQLVDTQWAQDAGGSIAARMALGMDLGAYLVWRAAIKLAAAARGQFPDSEPKDPRSPLRGLIESGEMIGERIAIGIRNSIPVVHGASLAMAGAAVVNPAFGTSAAMAGGAAGFTGPGTTYILQVEGEPITISDRPQDVLDRWQQMTSLATRGVT